MPARTCTLLGAALAGTALVMAIGAIWLVLTDPVSLAYAVGEGGTPALVEAVAKLVVETLEGLIARL